MSNAGEVYDLKSNSFCVLGTDSQDVSAIGGSYMSWDNVVAAEGVRLQRPQGSAWHKVIEARQKKHILWPDERLPETAVEIFNGSAPHVFVVEHDWAGVFAENTEGLIGGEVKLPYDDVCFEFRLNGRRVLYRITKNENTVAISDTTQSEWREVWSGRPGGYGTDFRKKLEEESGRRVENGAIAMLLVEAGYGWIVASLEGISTQLLMGGSFTLLPSLRDDAVRSFVKRQVLAVAIALDAQIATGTIIDAPTKLNAARIKKGKVPLSDYRVVSLTRRRLATDAAVMTNPDRRGPRLHFRRGHWHHFHTKKGLERKWVSWMLVGNPDLGFIDKHYRV